MPGKSGGKGGSAGQGGNGSSSGRGKGSNSGGGNGAGKAGAATVVGAAGTEAASGGAVSGAVLNGGQGHLATIGSISSTAWGVGIVAALLVVVVLNQKDD